MKRVAIYTRISRGKWQRARTSLLSQLQKCREYAIERGWQIVAELTENDFGAPGSSMSLPGLNYILDLAENDQFDVLLVTELDRLSRSLEKQVLLEEQLKNCGIEIEFVEVDYKRTPEGNLEKLMRAVVAEYESLKIQERQRRGRAAAVRAGNVNPGIKAPYGYSREKINNLRNLVIIEDEAYIVRLIYKWYTSGDSSGQPITSETISEKLTSLRIPPPFEKLANVQGRGMVYGRWSSSGVRLILSSETYIGRWRYGKKGTDSEGNNERHDTSNLPSVSVPKIMGREIWDIAQIRRKTYIKWTARKHNYLLRNRAECHNCGKLMFPNSNIQRNGVFNVYYYCPGARKPKIECKNSVYYQLYPIENATLKWLRILLGQKKITEFVKQQQMYSVQKVQEEIDDLDQLLDKNNLQMKRLLDLEASEKVPQTMIQGKRKRLILNNDAIANRLEELDKEIQKTKEFSKNEVNPLNQVLVGSERENNWEYRVRRMLIEKYDVTAYLGLIDGKKMAHLACNLGDAYFVLRNKYDSNDVPVIREINGFKIKNQLNDYYKSEKEYSH